jgi:hypothetical protein
MDYVPVYIDGDEISLTATAAITAGQLLEVTGIGTVGPASAASLKVVGVAAADTASGNRVMIFSRGQGSIHEVINSGGVTAGDQLIAAAGGKVATLAPAAAATLGDVNNARAVIGVALGTAADALKVRFLIR